GRRLPRARSRSPAGQWRSRVPSGPSPRLNPLLHEAEGFLFTYHCLRSNVHRGGHKRGNSISLRFAWPWNRNLCDSCAVKVRDRSATRAANDLPIADVCRKCREQITTVLASVRHDANIVIADGHSLQVGSYANDMTKQSLKLTNPRENKPSRSDSCAHGFDLARADQGVEVRI